MQLSYKLLHVALFGAGAFGAVANWGASKLNQYKTIEDWYFTSEYIVWHLYTNEFIAGLI